MTRPIAVVSWCHSVNHAASFTLMRRQSQCVRTFGGRVLVRHPLYLRTMPRVGARLHGLLVHDLFVAVIPGAGGYPADATAALALVGNQSVRLLRVRRLGMLHDARL